MLYTPGYMGISSFYDALVRIMRKKWSFLAVFLAIFFVSLSGLVAIGMAPGYLMALPQGAISAEPRPSAVPAATSTPSGFTPMYEPGEGEEPIGIDIPSVGVKANVMNPVSTDLDDLDAALLNGAVRYPTSARLGEEGNVIVFGHSSYLPVVHNQSFKAFNELSKLQEGELVLLYSAGKRYIYAVESVEPANVANDAIPLAVEGARLTLVTCNSFGDKSDRFIVTAKLTRVESAQQAAE